MFILIKNWLLGDIEESEYRLLSTETKDGVSYEVRRYDACKYVCVGLEGRSFDQASGDLQQKLQDYIGGENEQGQVMSTPVPLLFTVFPRDDGSWSRRMIAALRVPSAFQRDPPPPQDPSLRIEERPASTVYALRFGGFAGETEFRSAAERLSSALGDGAPYLRKQLLCCSFDPPLKPYARRNEVWLLHDERENTR